MEPAGEGFETAHRAGGVGSAHGGHEELVEVIAQYHQVRIITIADGSIDHLFHGRDVRGDVDGIGRHGPAVGVHQDDEVRADALSRKPESFASTATVLLS